MRNLFRISVVIALALLFVGGYIVGFSPTYAYSGSSTVNKPVFVWMFGYTGDTFTPQSQLGLSQSYLVSQVKTISSAVGKSNLRLVAVVGEEPGANVQSSSESAIRSYVSSLKQYASVVYGRIDLEEFNSGTSPTLQSQISLYASLGLNGVWFDHGPNEWASMGSSKFNSMMQSIIKSYPDFNFIMNQAVEKNGWITPSSGTTWGPHTYISPSVDSGSCCTVNDVTIAALNKIYPGRVLLHFDAFATTASEPMGIFADKTTSQQESAVSSLVHAGINPKSSSYAYNFQFPILGAWTYNGSKYHGTLYNSFSSGKYDRGTESSFISTMKTV
jgi:hypothetical protein